MNGIRPRDFFENIVSIYDDAVINGTTIFKKKVIILAYYIQINNTESN